MSLGKMCQCCLLRPPDKDLKSSYRMLGKTEIYADMLKECFEIHISASEGESGICEICITRLRDSCDFKNQVQLCQKELQAKIKDVKAENKVKVKEENDLDNDIYFLELKEEMSDYDENKDDADQLVEMLSFKDVTVKKKTADKKKNGKKRTLVMEKKEIDGNSKKVLGEPIRLHLNSTISNIRFLTESQKYLSNVKNVLKYSNCTPFSNKTLAGLICAYCMECCPDIPTLRAHTQETHKIEAMQEKKRADRNTIKLDITDLKCNLCDANFNILADLKKHLTKEHAIKFYPEVNDYIIEFKLTETEILNCALCNSTFETFKMLLQHMNRHYRNFICGVCDMGFVNQNGLKSHRSIHRVGDFKCTICDKVFPTEGKKKFHEKFTHSKSARYKRSCPHCGETFTYYYQRNKHMSEKHNISAATYKCNICDKSFMMKALLTAHIQNVHLMERNHTCSVCGRGFFSKKYLEHHMAVHNSKKSFECTVCHNAYSRKNTLREHMRIHNNDRRFKCGVCGSTFVQKCSLKGHMVSKHGITLSEYEATCASP